MDLATGALQQHNVEQTCSYAEAVIDIVKLGSSDCLRDGMQKLRRQLDPYAGSASVNWLDQRMRQQITRRGYRGRNGPSNGADVW